MTFNKWWKIVKELARNHELEWLLSEDPEDHRFAWEDGDTPRQHIQDLYEDLQRIGNL